MSIRVEEKIARQKLSLLQLTEALGNISAARSRRRISRTMFYEYKRRFQTQGLKGLRALPLIYNGSYRSMADLLQDRDTEPRIAQPGQAADREDWRLCVSVRQEG